MRLVALLCLVLVCTSCADGLFHRKIYIHDTNWYGPLKDGFARKDSLVSEFDGSYLMGRGHYARAKTGEVDYRKTGYWQYYYPNGKLKMEGSYKIGNYVQCCIHGPCMVYYHYRDGIWKYYNEDGSHKFELTFVPQMLHVNTSCEGGDEALFGLIEKPEKLQQRYGMLPADILDLQTVISERNDYYKVYLFPESGQLKATVRDNSHIIFNKALKEN